MRALIRNPAWFRGNDDELLRELARAARAAPEGMAEGKAPEDGCRLPGGKAT